MSYGRVEETGGEKDPRNWIVSVLCTEILAGMGTWTEEPDPSISHSWEPLDLVESALGRMGPQPPKETRLDGWGPLTETGVKQVLDPNPKGATVRWVGEVLGAYKPDLREIEIYLRSIKHAAQIMGCEVDTLVHKVRIHEYGHAITHLGTPKDRSVPGNDGVFVPPRVQPNDWPGFLNRRNEMYKTIPADTRELLAQAVTWAVLEGDQETRDVFLQLMERQPLEYQLSSEIRGAIDTVGIGRVLRWLWQEDAGELHDADFLRRLLAHGESSWPGHYRGGDVRKSRRSECLIGNRNAPPEDGRSVRFLGDQGPCVRE